MRKTQFPRLVIPLAVVLTSAVQPRASTSSSCSSSCSPAGVAPDVDVAAVPARARCCWSCSRRRSSMILVRAVPALPRHRRSSGASRSTALFYATPVLYPIEIVSGTLRDIIALNPLAPMFELARKWVIDPDAPGPGRRRRTAARWLVAGAHLRRRLRRRGVGLQARGAADRRGAVRRVARVAVGARRRARARLARRDGARRAAAGARRGHGAGPAHGRRRRARRGGLARRAAPQPGHRAGHQPRVRSTAPAAAATRRVAAARGRASGASRTT